MRLDPEYASGTDHGAADCHRQMHVLHLIFLFQTVHVSCPLSHKTDNLETVWNSS